MKKSLLVAFLSALTITSWGQEKEGDLQNDSLNTKNVKILAVPIVFYTPETSFGFGAGGQLFFRNRFSRSGELNSNILASVIYTINKQLIIQAKPQVYFGDETFFLDGEFTYKVYPNVFWGLGPETLETASESYNQTEVLVKAALLKKLPGNINFGFEFGYANYNITEVEPDGMLASGGIEGSEGAKLLGLGLILNLDSRDNKFSPLGGGLYQFKTNFTSRAMGSSHSINNIQLDFRKYINMASNHILAMQLYTRFTFGNAPFQAMAHYGGGEVARGFFKGRYIDNNLFVAQVEYRLPVWKRFELAAFALTGNVGSEGSNPLTGLKSSIGFGPRYFFFKGNRSVLRLDIGFNNQGGSGIYFGVNEAF